MKIQHISLATSIVLGLMFISIILLNISRLVTDNDAQTRISIISQANSLMQEATIELSLERSVMQVTLNLPTKIPDEFKSILDGQREKSDRLFSEAAALLSGQKTIPEAEVYLAQISDIHNKISNIRQKADRGLAVPKVRRNYGHIEQLPSQMKKAIEGYIALSTSIYSDQDVIPKPVLILGQIQKLAWEIREYGGRERTYMAIATALKEPIPDFRMEEMPILHARAAVAMDKLEYFLNYPNLPSEIKAEIEGLRAHYFGRYSNLRENIIQASNQGQRYSVSFEQYFERSTEALNKAVQLSYNAGAEIDRYLGDQTAHKKQRLVFYAAFLILAMLVCGFQIYFIIYRVSKRMDGLSSQMEQLAEGNKNIDINRYIKGSDEIGVMARTVDIFRNNALEMERMEAEQAEQDKRQAEQRRAAMISMADQFEELVGSVVLNVEKAAEEMNAMASQLAQTLNKTSEQSSSVASASQDASSNVETVAAAAEEMAASIQEISRNLSDTATTTKSCSEAARVSQDKLQHLQQAVEEIDSVIQSINDVAEQTNLLALNATIEAARAGEAGKGFAVVANEVKSLAGQTHKMTDEISRKVEDIKTSAAKTIESVNDIIGQIGTVDDKTTSVSAAVEEQSSSTSEISRNVQQAAGLTSRLTSEIQEVQVAANDSASSTSQLKDASDELSRQAGDLKEAVDKFLGQVRAA